MDLLVFRAVPFEDPLTTSGQSSASSPQSGGKIWVATNKYKGARLAASLTTWLQPTFRHWFLSQRYPLEW